MKRKVVALTGGIGSGKSEVARILHNMSFKTLDCDDIAKRIADTPEIAAKVEQLLGNEYVSGGKLNRKAIRERVFADESLLKQYQTLFFDGVKQQILNTLITLNDEVVFVEIPVLDAFEFDWHEVWCVQSDEPTRINRVTARDNVSVESVKNTIARQKRYANCARVIKNNGSLAELSTAVKNALEQSELLK